MSEALEQQTVREVLRGHTPTDGDSAYIEYARAAYGDQTIGQLTDNIAKVQAIGCHNDHELTGASFVECPIRPMNSLCSHQCESGNTHNPANKNELWVAKEKQVHVTGLLRAGQYVLEVLGQSAHLPSGKSLHESAQQNAGDLGDLDNPAFLEFERFRTEKFFRPGTPALEQRVKERLPTFMAAETLPALKAAVNDAKMKSKDSMDEAKNAVLVELKALLGRE